MLEKLRTVNVITPRNQINKQAARILSNNPSLKQEILRQTNFLPPESELRIHIYCILHNIKEQPKCKVCGTPISFNKAKGRFNTYCPNNVSACSSKDVELQNRRKNTIQTKYGTDNVAKNASVRERIRKTNLEKYGGVAPLCDGEVKQKMVDTCLDRYGVGNPQQQKQVQQKKQQMMLSKYGTKTYAQSLVDKKSLSFLQNPTWLIEQHHTKKKTITHIAQQLGVSTTTVCRYCRLHEIEVKSFGFVKSISRGEQEIKHFVQQLIPDEIQVNVRNVIPPYELDIFIPSLNIAIEYCGIFWHSEINGGKDKKYHNNKKKLCNDQNIHLIQVWSSEWEQSSNIVKSRIGGLLKKNQRIYARKCQIVELSSKESVKFQQRTHIQGSCGGRVHLGLKYQNEIVAVMVFGVNRFKKTKTWELIRYSSELHTNVIGGASRLFNFFTKNFNPCEIVSYSDNRWNTGFLYQQLGFNFQSNTGPNYFYFNVNGNTDQIFNRMKFQKHKIPNTSLHFNKSLSEWENMMMNNYDRIWDCGSAVYLWTAT